MQFGRGESPRWNKLGRAVLSEPHSPVLKKVSSVRGRLEWELLGYAVGAGGSGPGPPPSVSLGFSVAAAGCARIVFGLPQTEAAV
jgi:hypothetical protein